MRVMWPFMDCLLHILGTSPTDPLVTDVSYAATSSVHCAALAHVEQELNRELVDPLVGEGPVCAECLMVKRLIFERRGLDDPRGGAHIGPPADPGRRAN